MNSTFIKIFLGLFIGVLLILGLVYMTGDKTNNLSGAHEDSSEILEPEEQSESPLGEVLTNTQWVWVRTETATGENIVAPEGSVFTLTFHEDGTLTPTTDCNGIFSSYVRNGEALSFGVFGQTQMYCEGSLENVYVESLSQTSSYSINEKELHLFLLENSGKMIFVTRK
jgi:heat shock protein HslJ